MTVRFDVALEGCRQILLGLLHQGEADFGKVVIVRDLMGRIHLALERGSKGDVPQQTLAALSTAAGPFWGARVLEGRKMAAPQAVFASLDAVELDDGLWLLERGVVGAEWGRAPLPNRPPTPPRAALYGLKGGVGRSTALCVWARHLAGMGKRVLVVDLDLESPGVSSLLLTQDGSADFGLVDWFVEQAVGNADKELLRLMVARSPAASGTSGEILVAPCKGTKDMDYLAKLSRAYIDVPGASTRHFGERVAELIDQLEEEHTPDVVLIDSRAGLHDLAGVATTRLDAMTFLFAGASRQTWDGYRTLLNGWAKYPAVIQEVRNRVRVVAAMVPETERGQFLANLNQLSYDSFCDIVYEEASDATPDAFNFDVEAEDAPHFPLPTFWSRVFQDWDPLSSDVTQEQVAACYSQFLERATDMVLSEESAPGARNG